MAKFGEGDKRWIVEDRADGANVHNWHWSEKDCMEWSKQRFAELLQDIQILNGQGDCWIRTDKVESVEGEAYVNIRKGKIIPGYELKVRLNWHGEVKDGNGQLVGQVDGKVEFPYIADENADEDPELTISVQDNGPIGSRLREAMLKEGKPELIKRAITYIKDMTAGGPARDELSAKTTGKSAPAATQSSSAVPSVPKEAQKAAPAKKEEPKSSEKTRTITLTEKFRCRQQDLYETLLDERRWKAFTQSNAQITPESGGTFSLFDGAVTGVTQKLVPNSLIVQKWRFSNWEDGHYSTVCITIDEPEEGTTVVKLSQTNVPDEDRFGNATVVENTKRGWEDLIFHRIKAVFGFGI
eukprot:jgi/Mesen1/9879/ME000070S09160